MSTSSATYPKAKAYRIPEPLLERLHAWRVEEQRKRGKRMTESAAVFELLDAGLKALQHEQDTDPNQDEGRRNDGKASR